MRLYRLILLMSCLAGGAPGQTGNAPSYKLVEWPTEANSAAGFPAGPWNFIQVASVATSARGHILVLHRGTLRESGSHQALLAQRGIYYKLYQLQYKDQEAGDRRDLAVTGRPGGD